MGFHTLVAMRKQVTTLLPSCPTAHLHTHPCHAAGSPQDAPERRSRPNPRARPRSPFLGQRRATTPPSRPSPANGLSLPRAPRPPRGARQPKGGAAKTPQILTSPQSGQSPCYTDNTLKPLEFPSASHIGHVACKSVPTRTSAKPAMYQLYQLCTHYLLYAGASRRGIPAAHVPSIYLLHTIGGARG